MALKLGITKEAYRKKLLNMMMKAAAGKTDVEVLMMDKIPSVKTLGIYAEWCIILGKIEQRLDDLDNGNLKIRDKITGRFL